MPSLTQLEYVLAVDTHRHFGKAAQACNVSQPTLSMQLQKLEDELGVVVFDRSKKPILPTPVGEKIITQARIVVTEFKKISFLAKQTNEVSGLFRIGVIPTLSPYLLPLFLNRFSKSYPKVSLEIVELQTEQIVRMLERDELDAGLMATPLHTSSLQEDVICYEPFYLYAHSANPMAQKTKIGDDDLDISQLWLLAEGHCLRNQALRLCGVKSSKSVLKNVSFESGNLETLKRMVEQNVGCTLLPYLALVGFDPKQHNSVIVEFAKPIPSREVSLVYRRLHLKETIISALYDTICKSLPPELAKLRRKHLEVVDI